MLSLSACLAFSRSCARFCISSASNTLRLTSLVVGRRSLGKYSFSSVLVKVYFCSGSALGLTMDAIFFSSTGESFFSSAFCVLSGVLTLGACEVGFSGADFAAVFSAACAALLASLSWVACASVGMVSSFS